MRRSEEKVGGSGFPDHIRTAHTHTPDRLPWAWDIGMATMWHTRDGERCARCGTYLRLNTYSRIPASMLRPNRELPKRD